MLPVLICEPDETAYGEILECLAGVSADGGRVFRLAAFAGCSAEARRYAGAMQGALLLICSLSLPEGSLAGMELVEHVRERIRDLYAALLIGRDADVNELASSFARVPYILRKPIDPARARRIFEDIAQDYARYLAAAPDKIVLSSGGECHALALGCIVYAEALDRKVLIWTKRQCICVYASLGDVLGRLGGGFVRCHRSYIVNTQYIRKVDYVNMQIEMDTDVTVLMSRSGKEQVRQALEGRAEPFTAKNRPFAGNDLQN